MSRATPGISGTAIRQVREEIGQQHGPAQVKTLRQFHAGSPRERFVLSTADSLGQRLRADRLRQCHSRG